MAKVETSRSALASASHRSAPKLDAMSEHFFLLNDQFGEVVDGKVMTADDFVTDPHELSKYHRPSDDEIRDAVANGFRHQGLSKPS